MRRGLLIFFGVIVMLAAATSGWSDETKTYSSYGAETKITWPSVMFTVNVDNRGNVTGSGGQVKVSHKSNKGSGCDKVDNVDMYLAKKTPPYRGILHSPRPHIKLNLCNFNEKDATFNLMFPGSFAPEEILAIYKKWLDDCKTLGPKGGQMKTTHFFLPDYFVVYLNFKNGDINTRGNPIIPPVILNCAPCPVLNVRNHLDLIENTAVTVVDTSIVSGGIPPYTIRFFPPTAKDLDCTKLPPYITLSQCLAWKRSGLPLSFNILPKGLYQRSGPTVLAGTPTGWGTYHAKIAVSDSCRIATNKVEQPFTILVKDPTPPTLSALSISPSPLPAAGGDVVVKVTASDDRAVTDVTAAVSRPGWGMKVFVTRVSGNEKSGVWQGTYKAPPNTTNQDTPYTVDFIAADMSGNTSKSLSGTFIVKGSPGKPPPPTQYKYKK